MIPKVLGPLQSDGRSIKPSLIHGDLWEENTGLKLETGMPVVFDACVMYAHNEMELGMWRHGHYRFGKPYLRQYLSLMPPSEPVDQFDDRNRLYSMKYTLSHCQGWRDTSQISRQLNVLQPKHEMLFANDHDRLLTDMRYLSDKYSALDEKRDKGKD